MAAVRLAGNPPSAQPRLEKAALLRRVRHLARDREPALAGRYGHGLAVDDPPLEDEAGQCILQLALDYALQRPRAVDGIVARVSKPALGALIELERDLAVAQQPLEPGQLNIHDPRHVLAAQAAEQQDLVETVQELWPERGAHQLHHLVPHGGSFLALGQARENLVAQI